MALLIILGTTTGQRIERVSIWRRGLVACRKKIISVAWLIFWNTCVLMVVNTSQAMELTGSLKVLGTSIEQTVYNIDNIPTNIGQGKLDSCLLVLYDWANGLTLDSIEIEKERGVIHEEWRSRRSASSRIYERQLPLLYPNIL